MSKNNNKWIKWAAGLSGVITFTAFIGYLPHLSSTRDPVAASSNRVIDSQQDQSDAIEQQWNDDPSYSNDTGMGQDFSSRSQHSSDHGRMTSRAS